MGLQGTQTNRRLEFEQDSGLEKSCLNDDTMEALHSKISEDIIPKVGMEFETEDAAYEFYNNYALAVGFSIRRGPLHRDKQTKIVLDRKFVCSCEGKRGPDKRDVYVKSHRPETRFECLAMLLINCRQTGRYRVVNFIAKHGHNLASPSKAHLFRSHRKVSISQASQVEMANMSGIAPKSTYELMAREAGGRENVGFAHVDLKNYLRTKRSLQMKQGDTGGVLEYLQGMRVEDPTFFYAIQVDEDDLITNIFWADAKMMADYDDFGDVVCFDTTYRKLNDARPIALFVGVNHHKQTTIFGAALLYDETADSFVWLFDTFSRAMSGKIPKTMLTDQDAAMAKALAFQWPETYHRLCIWHIFQNAAVHLSSVFAKHKDFSRDFSNCIYDYEHEAEFLEAWSKMLDKYDLESNGWLQRMFNIKEKWALVYGRATFCADMTTTQRSESMNNMLKHYVSHKHKIRDFFEHFQRLLNDRRYDEMIADFKASQSKVVMSYPIEVLKNVVAVYTPEVFKLFEKEVYKCHDYHLEKYSETETLVQYMVTPHKKQSGYIVSTGVREEIVYCSCRKFEFAGLLCSHILKVLSYKGITEVPSKYILKRWTNNAKKGSIQATDDCSNLDPDPKKARGWRYRDLCRLSTRLFTRAAELEDKYNIVKEGLDKLIREINSSSTERPAELVQNYNTNPSQDMPMNLNGVTTTIKGMKSKPNPSSRSSKRRKSALETATRKGRKPKQNRVTEPQGGQTIHLDESDVQQSTLGDFCPSNPYAYGSTTLESGHHQYFQPSHMTLLTSIGLPQVQVEDIFDN